MTNLKQKIIGGIVGAGMLVAGAGCSSNYNQTQGLNGNVIADTNYQTFGIPIQKNDFGEYTGAIKKSDGVYQVVVCVENTGHWIVKGVADKKVRSKFGELNSTDKFFSGKVRFNYQEINGSPYICAIK